MKKGFIYTALRQPFNFFSYPKSEKVREFEEMVKKVHGIDISLDDRQCFFFEMGYKFGYIDGEHDVYLNNLKGD